jgi:hypothetical protein
MRMTTDAPRVMQWLQRARASGRATTPPTAAALGNNTTLNSNQPQ